MSQNQHFKHGVVVGKFYPFHAGHKYLIEAASHDCDRLTIMVAYHKDDAIPGLLRASWIRATFPEDKYEIITVDQDLECLPDHSSQAWADYTIKVLNGAPDAVFTSESYGDEWARLMGCEHVFVDLDRNRIPSYATLIRSNPLEYLSYLDPIVRAYFVKRILIIGSESTGKTTLAKALAHALSTIWVPEYGYIYTTFRSKEGNQDWNTEEFNTIAHTQSWMEDYLAGMANKVIVCDTDAYTTSLFHTEYLGYKDEKLEAFALSRPKYDLYILTDENTSFVQDDFGYRLEGVEHVKRMNDAYIDYVHSVGGRLLMVSGKTDERVKTAITAISEILQEPRISTEKLRDIEDVNRKVSELKLTEGV